MTDILPVIETLENRWMRAWVGGDSRTLKQLTARNFRLVMGSKPCAILDAKSWLDAATTSFLCEAYRFGDVYARDLGPVSVFATQLELKASIDGHDWSGRVWVTDIWKKSGVRRSWRMVERVFSRPEEDKQVPAAIRSLQLWQRPANVSAGGPNWQTLWRGLGEGDDLEVAVSGVNAERRCDSAIGLL